MKHNEIIEKEKRKSVDDLYTIHFYLDGDWWRAYEWSSYLYNIFPDNLGKNNKLNVTHVKSEDNENGMVFIGLKQSSFVKYFPNTEPSIVGEKHIAIDVAKHIKNENISLETYASILNEWKASIPIKQDKTTSNERKINDSKDLKRVDYLTIIQEVLAYPLDNRTLIENVQFISYLKREFSKCI